MTTFFTPARAAAFNLCSVIRPAISSFARAESSAVTAPDAADAGNSTSRSTVRTCLASPPLRRHAETSEPILCTSLRAKRSNPGAAVRPSGLLTPRMLWPLDCFVARAPRDDGWVAADPIASVVIGRRLITARKRTVPSLKARFERKDLLGRTSQTPPLTERPIGHGLGDFEIKATVMIKDDSCHIAFSSPPQIPYFINSYEGNSHSGVYLGLMMFAALTSRPPLRPPRIERARITGLRPPAQNSRAFQRSPRKARPKIPSRRASARPRAFPPRDVSRGASRASA